MNENSLHQAHMGCTMEEFHLPPPGILLQGEGNMLKD